MEAAKRVAKNTGILYARMAITVFISLYSTRLILAALGVADFGLFNVVGGVISMLGFLNSSMAAATQRFMSFAQGAGDLEKVKRIFNMSSLLHWGIALLVFLLLEGAGYFFFHGVLNIAPNRMDVAKLIYQFMVISTLFTVISVPYEAVITSHENMLVYTIMGVTEAALKLTIAFYITYTGMDHLVKYGVLMAALSILLLLIKRIYCHRVYEECHLHVKQYYDRTLLMEMGGFAGWSLLGGSTSILSYYGQGIVINIFFGTVVNAAQGIAGQIAGQLNVFSTTLLKALNPLLDKSEGAGNRVLMLKAAQMGSKISFFLLTIIYIPFLIELPFIFNLWLNKVPVYAVLFCRLLLIRFLIEQVFLPLLSAITAQGDIKGYQISYSLITSFPLLISYILFIYGYPPYFLYFVFIIYALLTSVLILYYAKLNCQLDLRDFLVNILLRCFLTFIIIFSLSIIPVFMMENSLFRLLLVFLISTIFFMISVYTIGFSRKERELIKEIFENLIKRFVQFLNSDKIKLSDLK